MDETTPSSRPGGPLPPVKVLLVDDEPANLLALEAVLDGLGQELVRAGSGEEALRRLEGDDYAVVLLDVKMHGLDGFETARRVRARERSAHTPIIFLTAYESPDFPVVRAYALGAVDYLVKPIVPEILRAKVAMFVDLYQKAERLRRLERAEYERRLADEARRQTEERFRLLADSSPALLWLAGPDGRRDFFSRRWLELTGRDPERERGDGWLEGVHPDDRPACAEACAAALAGRRPFRVEYRLRGADGADRWVLDTGTPRLDGDGRLAGYVGSALDITDRREAEERLREADRRKDHFLAMLAHELRNPLAPVVTGLHILGLSEADRQMVDQARGMMERQVRHLTRLVDDLMDVSRITLGKVQVRRERLDLARVVRDAAEDRRALVEQAGMSLEVAVPPGPVWVAGDATRLAQVLGNLLDNAVKFRNGGCGVSVRLGVEPAGSWAVLDVRDDGVGIDPEVFPRLFDVFAQADRSLDRRRGGLGVGLSIVRGLVRLHGGEVEASSDGPGHGAAFRVRLPIKEEQPALTEMPAGPPDPAAGGLRVLIVEDNRDAADSLRMLLELSGHQVAVAYDGNDGVRVAREWRPDVVLCDIGLPGLDGYGVASELRRDPATARVPLIAITGYGAESDRRRSKEAGFDHHLTKPVDPDALRPLLGGPA